MRDITCLVLLAGAAYARKQVIYMPAVDDFLTVNRLTSAHKPQPLSDLRVTDNVVQLRRADSDSYSLSALYVQQLRRQGMHDRGIRPRQAQDGTTPLFPVEGGQIFLTPVTVGGQERYVVIDTGSSDPWLVQTEYVCVDYQTKEVIEDRDCYFGEPYDMSKSSTYEPIPNEHFNISYADGEFLNGVMAYESFTMAGITVPRQKFGVVDHAAWFGDEYSSGLVGFAYRTLTSAYSGQEPRASLLYNPLFVNMYTDQGVPPVFSMAIDRSWETPGIMAIGGIPDIPHSPVFVNTPIIPRGVNLSSGASVYEFYTIQTDGFAIAEDGSTQFNPYRNNNPKKRNLVYPDTQAIVDSGTSLMYVADDIADLIAQIFSPPGTYDDERQVWFVQCDAASPVFGVGIAGKVFYVNPQDLKVPVNSTHCISGVQRSHGPLTILGDVWMKSVLCVFDIGAEQMRFAAREFYNLTAAPVVRPTT